MEKVAPSDVLKTLVSYLLVEMAEVCGPWPNSISARGIGIAGISIAKLCRSQNFSHQTSNIFGPFLPSRRIDPQDSIILILPSFVAFAALAQALLKFQSEYVVR